MTYLALVTPVRESADTFAPIRTPMGRVAIFIPRLGDGAIDDTEYDMLNGPRISYSEFVALTSTLKDTP